MDDDADVRSVVEATLSAAGFEPTGAADGSEGIERAVLERPDLVLLDVVMPHLSGWEVCATLRSLPAGMFTFQRISGLIGRESARRMTSSAIDSACVKSGGVSAWSRR